MCILIFFLIIILFLLIFFFFFFNDTATTEIYTLSLHDALPILLQIHVCGYQPPMGVIPRLDDRFCKRQNKDRKSTRLNSSHLVISYAVFCLKKKKTHIINTKTSSALRYYWATELKEQYTSSRAT